MGGRAPFFKCLSQKKARGIPPPRRDAVDGDSTRCGRIRNFGGRRADGLVSNQTRTLRLPYGFGRVGENKSVAVTRGGRCCCVCVVCCEWTALVQPTTPLLCYHTTIFVHTQRQLKHSPTGVVSHHQRTSLPTRLFSLTPTRPFLKRHLKSGPRPPIVLCFFDDKKYKPLYGNTTNYISPEYA